MVIILKKRYLLLVVVFLAVIIFALFFQKNIKSNYVYLVPSSKYLVVVDAGHGGIDGGCVGKDTGVYESNLNLKYAYNLATQLSNMNISVILTRTDENGLYDSGVPNLKKSDMLKRKNIIESNAPDLVISIHMNSFPLRSCNGAQAFYKKGSQSGKILAQDIQGQLYDLLDNARTQANVGDYYIVNCTDIPSVLVECGYLSNPNEERLLQQEDYQNKVCYAISCGVIKFLNENKHLEG